MQFLSDHWIILLLTFPVWSAPLMLVWYAIGIQVERGGIFKILTPFTFAGFLFDILLQYTVANLWFWEIGPTRRVPIRLLGFEFHIPVQKDFTISMRIGRLMESKTWGGAVSRWLAPVLNRLAPSGRHIEIGA